MTARRDEQRTPFSIPSVVWLLLLLAGLAAVFVGVVMLVRRVNLADNTPLIVAAAGGVLAVIGALGLERKVSGLQSRVTQTERARRADYRATQERSRSLYELAFLMGSTLKYDKILDAALEAGRLALRSTDTSDKGLVAAVMLFQADDNLLHVVSSRRLTRADDGVTLPGKDGLVGRALQEAEPVIGENPRRDPELQYIIALQSCKSVLIIPLRTGFDNFGVLIYASEKPNIFGPDHADLLTAVGIQATIALQNSLLYQHLRDERDKIIEVEEDARKKLARDLHDGPTQSIAAIAMRMGYINKLYQKSPAQVPDELKKVEELARKTTKEIRHMLFTLRPLVLESHGITVALNQLADKMVETHGQNVTVTVHPDVELIIDHHQQGVIFYIVEEAINNARKHAQATLIRVQVFPQGEYVVVQIIDNGKGFDTAGVSEGYENRGSLGMLNMRERAELIDGVLKVESKPGTGTIITVYFPRRGGAGEGTGHLPVPRGTTRLALAASERVNRIGSEQQRRW
jgi:signal transduction histidine kinase